MSNLSFCLFVRRFFFVQRDVLAFVRVSAASTAAASAAVRATKTYTSSKIEAARVLDLEVTAGSIQILKLLGLLRVEMYDFIPWATWWGSVRIVKLASLALHWQRIVTSQGVVDAVSMQREAHARMKWWTSWCVFWVEELLSVYTSVGHTGGISYR